MKVFQILFLVANLCRFESFKLHSTRTSASLVVLRCSSNDDSPKESIRSQRRKKSKSSTTLATPATQSPLQGNPNNIFASDTVILPTIPQVESTPITAAVPKSKLTPLTGTTEEIQQKYAEKNAVQRYIEELQAPTIPGQEPKTVQLIKAITWFSIILLVVLEIIVSIKTGNSPPPTSIGKPFPSLQELSYPDQ